MKARLLQASGAVALTFVIVACIPRPQPPAPSPAPVGTPAPTPAPAPVATAPAYENYLDAPQTPGDWRYEALRGGGVARFGTSGSTVLELGCDASARQVVIGRASSAARSRVMTITTETVERDIVAEPVRGRDQLAARLPANDPLLDAMAVTKGRFALATQGEATLYVPAWVEVSRVIEDCR